MLRRGGLVFAATAGIVALFATAPAAPAADRFVAGEVALRREPLAGADAGAYTARARTTATALGLPFGTRRAVARVVDRFNGTTYVEVTARDAAGEPVSLARYGDDGRLQAAIRFGWKATGPDDGAGGRDGPSAGLRGRSGPGGRRERDRAPDHGRWLPRHVAADDRRGPGRGRRRPGHALG